MAKLTVELADGELVTIPSEDTGALYDQLWKLAPRRGAAMAAVKLGESQTGRHPDLFVKLTEHESAAFCEAVAHGHRSA